MLRETKQGKERELTGYHVLFGFLALFGLFAAANAYFINAALSTHSGVVAKDSYRKGLKYNERIAASKAQAALGWSHNIDISKDKSSLQFALLSSESSLTSGLHVTARIQRPATSNEDTTLKMTDLGGGRYSATLHKKILGNYIVDVEVADPTKSHNNIVYRARQRLWVKP